MSGVGGGPHRVFVGLSAAARQDAAAAWLRTQARDQEVLVVGPTVRAADVFVRGCVARDGARFGLRRLTFNQLAGALAAEALALRGLVPTTDLAFEAVVARVVQRLTGGGGLAAFGEVTALPGFARAAARTLTELRAADVDTSVLASHSARGAALSALASALEEELLAAGLADRALVYALAVSALDRGTPDWLRGSCLLLDVPLPQVRAARLWAAVRGCAAETLAAVPAGDVRSLDAAGSGLDPRAITTLEEPADGDALARMRAHLFTNAAPPATPLDETVELSAHPGEARECVELARRIQAEAARGVPFERMAILLRSPAEYAVPVEEALARAELPAHFARGSKRPHAAGRALLALLQCAGEGLSARRFAEYLSLAQVPEPDATPSSLDVAPIERELLGFVDARLERLDDHTRERTSGADTAETGERPLSSGAPRAPWRWELLLVDASVIGGRDRWARRLAGLANELRVRADEARVEDEARAQGIERTAADLEDLRTFALPLLERLAALPRSATWGQWLDALRPLCDAALREPGAVLATLSELAPLGPVGPVGLDEVEGVLRARLRDLTVEEKAPPSGRVFVAPIEQARGHSFDVVFVPGLAERMFPRKILEDPLLLDEDRARVSPHLTRLSERANEERLLLRVAVGAARRRLVLSYPRLDVAASRSRVPSFYAVEALRAAEGDVRGLAELAKGTRSSAARQRLGWPAPEDPRDAIDEAELDLALLGPQLDGDAERVVGAARYLLDANPHLARALRSRARRYLRRWTAADGLVELSVPAHEALRAHRLDARSYSATALQNFAACPYRFYLQAIVRLSPWEDARSLETLDALTRGSLFHDVQFEVLTRLRADGELPVTDANLAHALEAVDRALTEVAGRYHDELAPAIERVWEDAQSVLRADLREWLRIEARRTDGFIPDRFELSFGLADRHRDHADPSSVAPPIELEGGLRLRGSIDLVERHATEPVLRVTDHKTGKARAKENLVLGGGEHLQPVLYALACERLLSREVVDGRLYYCTADGQFSERTVHIDQHARQAAKDVIAVIGGELERGFLPAAPKDGACRFCDFKPICGAHEEQRTRRKPKDALAALERLRGLR